MRKVFIYILVDPRAPEVVRYVGQTLTPRSRHIQHCCESGQSAKCQWIESLRFDGVMPQMVIVEETTSELAAEKERTWIARFASSQISNTKHVPTTPPAKPETKLTLKTMNEAERDLILSTLEACHGNKLEASKRLGIGRQTLYNKLKTYQPE